MTINIISGVSQNGVIGQNNNIPWNYPEDMKFFRTMTTDATVIMGRKTLESMNSKPLTKRRNIVITHSTINGIECFSSLSNALNTCSQENVWLIGGSEIYREGMKYANNILITLIPKTIDGENLTYFPWINPSQFMLQDYIPLFNPSNEETMKVAKYIRIN